MSLTSGAFSTTSTMDRPKLTCISSYREDPSPEYATNPPHAFRFGFASHHPDALRAFEHQHRRAVAHGQIWNDDHANVLRELQQSYVLTALGLVQDLRTAWPLAVGTGKTESVVAFARSQYDVALRGGRQQPLTLLVCMERVAQMRDLYNSILSAGVPSTFVACYHTKTTKEIKAEQLPPSVTLEGAARFPVLIASHSMMLRGENNIAAVSRYKDGERHLTIWDESLIRSQGYHFDLEVMEAAVARLRVRCGYVSGDVKAYAAEAVEFLSEYLSGLQEVFNRRQVDPSSSCVVEPPSLAEGQLTRYETAIDEALRDLSERDTLKELCDHMLRPVRVVPVQGKDHKVGVIRYEMRIPASLKRLVVLDASHNIRRLTGHHDSTIATARVACNVKSFEAVNVQCIKLAAGKGKLADVLRSAKSSVRLELIDRVRALPQGASALFVTFKDEPKESARGHVQYTRLLKSALRDAGVDPDEILFNAKRRFEFITWGQHLGVCTYAHCGHLFAVGVIRRPQIDLSAAIVGQRDDLAASDAADLDEVRAVELSEMFHHLMQFAGRGSCRNTENGKARKMQLTVICHDFFDEELWQEAMPGVAVYNSKSKHDTSQKKANAMQDAILQAFAGIPWSDSQISVRTLKVRAGLEQMRPDQFSRMVAQINVDGWARNGRSFVRCPFDFDAAA